MAASSPEPCLAPCLELSVKVTLPGAGVGGAGGAAGALAEVAATPVSRAISSDEEQAAISRTPEDRQNAAIQTPARPLLARPRPP